MRSANVFVMAAAVVTIACGSDEPNNPYADGSAEDTATDPSGSGPTTSVTATGDESETGGGIKYDVPTGETEGDYCGCGLNPAFSFIWIANAGEGTVSKVNTKTMEEVGRYISRPDGIGDPSRTSVSLSGDVAVANRNSGLTKIYAREKDCVDSNGMAGIQTSQGKANVLAWGFEECVAWHTPFPTTNQRPVAWAQGTLDQDRCSYDDEKIWTVGSAVPGIAPGTGGPGGVIVWRVNGDTGAIEDTIQIDEFSGNQLGAYGGAADGAGNFWFSPMGALELMGSNLARVDAETLAYEIVPIPQGIATYGITVDHLGKVWVSSTLGPGAARFDPDSDTWDVVNVAFSSTGGLQEDGSGRMWVSTGNPSGAVAIDTTTLATGAHFLTGGDTVKGISIDVDGFVWVVSSIAERVDPDTLMADVYNGLTSPYTYSDMTGWALQNAACPPEG